MFDRFLAERSIVGYDAEAIRQHRAYCASQSILFQGTPDVARLKLSGPEQRYLNAIEPALAYLRKQRKMFRTETGGPQKSINTEFHLEFQSVSQAGKGHAK